VYKNFVKVIQSIFRYFRGITVNGSGSRKMSLNTESNPATD